MSTRSKVFGGLGVVIALVAVGLIVYFTTRGTDCPGPATASPPAPFTEPAAPTTPAPAPEGPVVRVQQGSLEGLNKWTRGTGANHVQYAAFWGVPYAKPPVGPLRFKAPRPHPAWTGVRPAKQAGPRCAQGKDGDLEGSEDCLFLNVFTTNLNKSQKQPVYVFVHGGGFPYGAPTVTRFGPDYLLPHGVVVVTVQYRLGALGFLSLDTEEIPGNCALKDLVAALQWVHNNIAAFGGDPDKVTIGGQSSGASLAGWLTRLPEMKGIIHGATLMSGSPFHNWAYTETHVQTALQVASNIAHKTVTDTKDAEQYLMNASIEELHVNAMLAINAVAESQPEVPVVPTPERRPRVSGGEPLLIVKDKESYFLQPEAPAIPMLIGSTNKEMLPYYYSNNPRSEASIDQELVDNIAHHVPKDLLPYQDTRKILGLPDVQIDYNTILEEVKKGVREAATVTPGCDLGCTLKTYFDNVWQTTDMHRLAMFRAKENQAETYLFKFSVRTDVNQPLNVPTDIKDVATHADDLGYYMTRLIDLDPKQDADLAIRRVTALWTNFIKYGKPVPKTDPQVLTTDWPPNTSSGNDVTFLEMKTDAFFLRQESFSGPMIQFWQDLYHKYRSKAPNPVEKQSVRAPGRERGL
ncbi:juvenile hormone esterase-like [Thrips palmi]|uniref:Carboxylic ester hydrolase n=1 Tax=Thrips palmi TaxID=161013 RepID=A0A6P9A6T5_THRPL|nr:juvenile hormone esterase-like [Thrips palmi]